MENKSAVGVVIPPGRKVVIYTGEKNNPITEKITCILNGELSLDIKSQFSRIAGDVDIPNWLLLLGDVATSLIKNDTFHKVVSTVEGRNAKLGYQVYKSTDPLSFSLPLVFTASTNAKTDVAEKVKALQKLVLPEVDKNGIFVSTPGVSSLNMLAQEGDEKAKGATIFLDIGNLHFNHVIIDSVQTTWSTEVDKTGYPISADVTLSVTSCFIPSQGTLDEVMYSEGARSFE